jgi:glycosyltransferase A (GT-A) superfamily protein (DUF2064 family)
MMAGNPVNHDDAPCRFAPEKATAVLIFADLPALDVARRRWPESACALIRPPNARRLAALGLDVHWFTTRGLAGWVRLPGAAIHEQSGGGFGRALGQALSELAELGYSRVVVVGSDCPQLAVEDIAEAAASLEEYRLVLGPDHRGGIYLLGIRTDALDLIAGVIWRQDTDFAQLSARLPQDEVRLLPVKMDLDRVVDLRLLGRRDPGFALLGLLCLLEGSPFVPAAEPPSFLRVQKATWQLPPPYLSRVA